MYSTPAPTGKIFTSSAPRNLSFGVPLPAGCENETHMTVFSGAVLLPLRPHPPCKSSALVNSIHRAFRPIPALHATATAVGATKILYYKSTSTTYDIPRNPRPLIVITSYILLCSLGLGFRTVLAGTIQIRICINYVRDGHVVYTWISARARHPEFQVSDVLSAPHWQASMLCTADNHLFRDHPLFFFTLNRHIQEHLVNTYRSAHRQIQIPYSCAETKLSLDIPTSHLRRHSRAVSQTRVMVYSET